MGKTNLIQTDFIAGEISPRMEMQSNLEGRKHGVALMKNFFTHLQGSAETSRGTEWVTNVDGVSGVMFGFPVVLLTSFMVVIADGQLLILDYAGTVDLENVLVNDYFTERGTGWGDIPAVSGAKKFLPGGVLLYDGPNPTTASMIGQIADVTISANYTLTVDVAAGDGPIRVYVGSAAGLTDILDETVYGTGRKTFPTLSSDTEEMHITISRAVGTGDKLLTGVHLVDPDDIVSFTCPWDTETSLESLQGHMIPEKTSMILTSVDYAPYELKLAGGVWTFAALALTSAPASWVSGNYPPAAGFHGGRLWVGGVPSDPSLIWGSKSGSYGDFTLGELDDDAIEFYLMKSGAVCWIAGGPGLLIGTSNAEHVITSSGGVITPSDKYSQIQSTNGSYPTQALEVGNEVMYISPDGRKLRSIGFEWLKDAWRSRDLTYASEHITKGDGALTQLRYAANPDSQIIGVTKGGNATTFTYEPYSQTVGASRRTTDGTIVSIGTVPFNGSDEAWFLVHRGGSVLSVEREHHPLNIKLDSYTRLYSNTAISGGEVPHLAEKLCQILVDGAVHPNVTPDDGGLFTTEYSGNEIYIGLQMLSTIRTLPVADEIANIGTTRAMKKRFTEVWIRILDSWRPKINGRRTPNRHALTPMGEVEPARTESVMVANDGWDLEAQITIEQDLPLRTEVAGWFGRILQEET